jgi:hypothetical protein
MAMGTLAPAAPINFHSMSKIILVFDKTKHKTTKEELICNLIKPI